MKNNLKSHPNTKRGVTEVTEESVQHIRIYTQSRYKKNLHEFGLIYYI